MKKNFCILIFLTSVTVWGMGSPKLESEKANAGQKENATNISAHQNIKKKESKPKYTPEQIRSMAGEASSHKR